MCRRVRVWRVENDEENDGEVYHGNKNEGRDLSLKEPMGWEGGDVSLG